MKKYNTIIFDLDGTLFDTSQGIFNSVRYTEKAMGFDAIDDDLLKQFVGPPPKDTYKNIYNISEEKAIEAVKNHRYYGKTRAIYEAVLYPDIKHVLSELKGRGNNLAVATLKQEQIAIAILKNYGIYEYFSYISGMDNDETLTKAETIKSVQRHLGKSDNVLMIGDTEYDLIGAREAEVDFLGVTYGFGFTKNDKYNNACIATPMDILKYLP